MSDNPVRPSAISLTPTKPFTPIRPIGPLTPIRLPIDPQLLSPAIRLVDLSGKTPQANAVVFLSFTSADGSERLERLAMPANGILSPASGSASEFLSRVRVFAPPADLVLDQVFPAGHVFLGTTALTVRENPPVLALRVGTIVPFQLLHRTPMTLLQNPMGSLPQITGLRTGGEPGAPSLPLEVHRILVPPGLNVSVETVADPSPTRVAAPLPQIQPPMVVDSPRRRQLPLTHFVPTAPPTTGLFPPAPVNLQRVEQHPWGSLATVTLSPVQFDASARQYIHQPNLGYHLHTTPAVTTTETADTFLFPDFNNRDRGQTLVSALAIGNVTVVGAGRQIWMLDPASLISHAPCGMVIITDDFTWSFETANPPFLDAAPAVKGAPLPANGHGNGLIAEFERLAYWKSSRGMRTKVVPISTIVGMHKTGDLKAFQPVAPLDLPEIIRSFIQYAQKNWQTDYVLLGGSKDIVPMRRVMAPLGPDNWRASSGTNSTVTVITTGKNTRIAKISGKDSRTPQLDDQMTPIINTMKLQCVSSGTLLPFCNNGNVDRGWYFTSAYDFANKTSGFEGLSAPASPDTPLAVIVYGGPEIDDDFRWVFPNATTETDFYYSDLARGGPGRHDWDTSGNLWMGQTRPDGSVSVDGVNSSGSISVGRAPVTSADEARNFVNKVMSYEQVRAVDAGGIDPYYLGRLTLYGDNWAHPWVFSQFAPLDSVTDPGPEQFVMVNSGANCMLDNTDGLVDVMSATSVSAVPAFSLQAILEAADKVIDIPYDATGTKATCWYFCDSKYNRLKVGPGVTGTGYVRVQNPPAGFTFLFWQYKDIDSGVVQKQRVRALWKNLFPDFGDVRRIYRDFEKFPGEPVDPMLQDYANKMMSEGTHFLSITGHGNQGNVSDFDVTKDASCGNVGRPYITYAHSCLTADPEANPSLGARLVNQENGALAYVGYARSCSTSDQVSDYELGFWCATQAFRRLGRPIMLRANLIAWVNYPHIYMMTFYGDPEMPVWTRTPHRLDVQFVYSIVPDGSWKGLESIGITATDNGKPVAGLDVTLLQGWNGSLHDPLWNFRTQTDDNGTAIAWIRSPRNEAMRVVVSAPVGGSDRTQYIPVIRDYTATQKS